MQQREKEKYENALGSIFDFIFEESKKPPSKVKPAKVTGVDGTTEIVDALSDVLTSPLLFVNDEIRNVFNDTMDITVPLKVGTRGGADTIKIKVSDIKDMVDDPGSWVDKQFKTLELRRKEQRAAWAGEEIKGILGALWARERDLDFETQMAMAGAGRKGGRTTGADSEYMVSRTNDLVSKHFGNLSGSETKADFVKKYGRERGERMFEVFGKWEEAKSKGEDLSLKPDIYYVLESQELKERARDAVRSGDKDKAEEYIKASNFVVNSHDERVRKDYLNSQRRLLGKYSQRIDQLKRSSDPDKDEKIKEIKKSMGIIKLELRYSRLDNAAGTLGRLEGAHYSMKNLFVDGNLLPDIINGRFFDERSNQISWLQPSIRNKKFLHKEGRKAIEFHAAKRGDGPLSSTYYTSMNAVYYMSPVTWARSLTNGEIFAYAAHMRREMLEKSDFIKGLAGFDVSKFMDGLKSGDDTYLNRFAGNLTKKQLDKLQKFAKWDKVLGNLGYVFNTPARVRAAIEEFIQKKIMRALRDKVGKVLLKVIKDKIAAELIKSWVITGGIKVLIKGIVSSIAATIGLVGTPVASAIIGAVTWIASDIIYKLAKPVLKFTLEVGRVLLYFFIGLGIVFLSLVFVFFALFARFTHVSPHEVVMCEAYEPMDPIEFPDLPPGEGGEDIDFECGPRETVQGLFSRMASEMGMSGAQLGLIPPGHDLYGDLDGGWWCWAYSMDQVYCKSDKVNSCNDYIVRLFKHELTHLRQYRNASGSYGSLFMEWGADYVSGNGGGYSFTTKNGTCIRATETPMLSGCSSEAYRGIAYNESSYLNSQCFGNLKSYITGFCGAP
jgi:hypothetical protein